MSTALGPLQTPAWLEGGTLQCVLGNDFEDVPVTSAFVLATTPERLALTCVRSRGWDLPGGHLDPGESAREAAVRELFEETSLRVSALGLTLIGSMRLHAPGQFARTGRYPDLSVMALYRARLPRELSLRAGTECVDAQWVRLRDVTRLTGERAWTPFLAAL